MRKGEHKVNPVFLAVSFLIIEIALRLNLNDIFTFYSVSDSLKAFTKYLYLPGLIFEDILCAALLFVFIKLMLSVFRGRTGFVLAYFVYSLSVAFTTFSSLFLNRMNLPFTYYLFMQVESFADLWGSITAEFTAGSYRVTVQIVALLLVALMMPGLMRRVSIFFSRYKKKSIYKFGKVGFLIFLILILVSGITEYLLLNKSFGIYKSNFIFVMAKSIIEPKNHWRGSGDQIKPSMTEVKKLLEPVCNKTKGSSPQKTFVKYKNDKKITKVILIILETAPASIYLDDEFADVTPTIHELKKISLWNDSHISPTTTSNKALYSILCGKYPLFERYDMVRINPSNSPMCMAEYLSFDEYESYFIHSGNKKVFSAFLTKRGFDHVYGREDLNKAGKYDENTWGVDDLAVYKKAFSLLSEKKGDKQFMVLVPINTHHPVWSPDDSYKKWPEDSDEHILWNSHHYQDHLISLLIKHLKEEKLIEKSLIIIVGDHSSRFIPGVKADSHPTVNQLAIESILVPLVIYAPEILKGNNYLKELSSHVDLLPTVLSIMGKNDDKDFIGENLLAPVKPRAIFSSAVFSNRVVKLIDPICSYDYDLDYGIETLYLNENEPSSCEKHEKICVDIKKRILDFKDLYEKTF